MKIVAGLGCIDDYIKLVKAGTDEVFCGFVPYEWNEKYGSLFPLNRREVLYYNVQINSYEDMKILKKMVDKYKVPVTITFNYLYYLESQYEEIENIMKNLINIGFNEFIIGDVGLLIYLKTKNINNCNIQLSGECAEINSLSVDFFNNFNIQRYIFHRKNTIEDMKAIIDKHKKYEYEAFILNEKCHFSGAFCSSLHCDELNHLCKISYDIKSMKKDDNQYENLIDKIDDYYEKIGIVEEDDYIPGSSGCGLCYLKKLSDAGVTHLKVVGRGLNSDDMVKDISALRQALDILKKSKNEEKFKKEILKRVFNKECGKECYYI